MEINPSHHHDSVPFDPLVAELERRREDFMDAEDYLNDEDKFNVTDRLVLLFPKIDVDLTDGFVTEHELTQWNVHQAQTEVLHRTQRDMELHDKNRDGFVSFSEYDPPSWVQNAGFCLVNQIFPFTKGFAAGLMLSISFFDLAHNALNSLGFLKGNLWFFAGVIIFAVIANFIPEPTLAPTSDGKSRKINGDDEGKDVMKKHRRQVLYSGIITAIGISLHNFPEGMTVFLGSIKGLRVGINLALAIVLHNIPEGVNGDYGLVGLTFIPNSIY